MTSTTETQTNVPSQHSPDESCRSGLKLKVNKWFAVSSWKWCTNDDDCGICRNPFETCCADCKVPGDDCPLVWGQCNHCYHMHCIIKWLNSQQVAQHCPLCRQDWRFRE
ncbi:Anaphase promoting complex subunit 11 [Fasciolopsis buskii]|uniref:Anaphase-promoting complex subunit 11 n=1 Tax=Fasciolopsis buskii TaxID=27845 RepID=A0A8E0RRG8_9TREM|nr:Anaphase promoting complex subunit 11 [Fasciolopsis buski]